LILNRSKSTLAVAAMCGLLGSSTTACGLPLSGDGPNRESSSGGSGSGSSSGGGSVSSSGSSSGSGSGSSSGGASGSGSGSSSGSGSGGDSGSTGDGGGDNACYVQASDACINCCYDDHPAGGSSWDGAFYACVCEPSNCATQCAQTDCSTDPNAGWPQPGDPCDLCEQQAVSASGGGACGAAVAAACNPVADCVALVDCANRCP
jgi:hypothetical protein